MKHLKLAGLALALLLSSACGQKPQVAAPTPAEVVAEAHTVVPVKPAAPKVLPTKPAKPKTTKPKRKKTPAPAPKSKPPRAVDPDAARRDCTGDVIKWCAPAIPLGRSSIIQCMERNRASLSGRCSAHFQ